MSPEILEILTAILPTLILIVGGQWVLHFYERKKKEREVEIELDKFRKERELDLMRSVRGKQYESIEALYMIFAKFMELYRLSSPRTKLLDISDADVRKELLEQAIEIEAKVDALIVRIGVEFGAMPENESKELATLLANLRQSVQIWREKFREGSPLPFNSNRQEDYQRFKLCFVGTASVLVSQYYTQLEKPKYDNTRAWNVVFQAFDFRSEVDSTWTSLKEDMMEKITWVSDPPH